MLILLITKQFIISKKVIKILLSRGPRVGYPWAKIKNSGVPRNLILFKNTFWGNDNEFDKFTLEKTEARSSILWATLPPPPPKESNFVYDLS